MAASCDLHINSSGENHGNVLTEDVWGGFLELKESTESALTRFASEKHTVQGIQEISRRHLSIKRCHSKLIRQLTGQAINVVKNSGGYEEVKYVIREITTLLIKTRNDRDSAVDMFLNNSTQHPMMNCMEELEEEVTPLPAQLSPSPVTAVLSIETQQQLQQQNVDTAMLRDQEYSPSAEHSPGVVSSQPAADSVVISSVQPTKYRKQMELPTMGIFGKYPDRIKIILENSAEQNYQIYTTLVRNFIIDRGKMYLVFKI